MSNTIGSFDFNDAKFLQYYYISEKVKFFLTIIKDLIKNISVKREIPDIKLIILLSGVIFNINDNIYRRSEILINGNKFNSIQLINPTVDSNPISFDSLENLLNFNKLNLIELPNFKKTVELLKLFESLLLNSYEILEKKLNVNIIREKKKKFEIYNVVNSENGKENENGIGEDDDNKNGNKYGHLSNKFKIEFNELLLINSLYYKQPLPNIKIINQETIKSFYRINEFNFLQLEINSFKKILKELNFKTLNINKDDIHFRHYMYLNILRLADLYVEIRKIGKVIYLDNIHYFINYAKQDRSIRLTLNSANNIFNNSKLNNMLLTLIMKFSKNNKNISNSTIPNNQFFNEFKKNIIDSINLLNKMISILADLNDHWLKIVKDDKVEEFNKEILREKLRLKTSKYRELKKQLLIENQKLLQKNQLNKFKSTSRSNSLNYSNIDFIIRHNVRTSRSTNSIKESKEKFIEENEEEAKDESKEADKDESKETDKDESEEGNTGAIKVENKDENKKETKEEIKDKNDNENKVENKDENKNENEEENLGNLEKLSITDSSDDSLTKEKSLNKAEISNNNLLNGLNRRSSLLISPNRSLTNGNIKNKNAIAGAGAASATMNRNKINTNSNYIQTNKNNNEHIIAAAALAVKRLPQQNLTAQQRLQQHILKSTKNGSVFGKPLETRRMSKIVSKPVIMLENKDENQEADQAESEEPPEKSLIEFPNPGSPLNSLKQSSNEAKVALKIQNRSRSNSNISNSSNNSASPSKYSSPNKDRSRSGSMNKIFVTKQVDELSRSDSISSSRSKSSVGSRSRSSSTSVTRSRSSSIVGNLNVVLANDVLLNSNGELIKKVRFSGIQEYNEDEDAPTPQQMQKQMRQKWAAYKPLFRKLNSQEGLAFKQNRLENEGGNGGMSGGLVTGGMNLNGGGLGVNGFLCVPPDSKGKVSMMSVLTGNVEHLDNSNKRLSRLFKRR